MCPHSESKKPFNIGDMSLDLAKTLIKEGPNKIKSVKFNWRGEPTLYRYLPEVIAYAKKNGYIETMINTNLNCSKKILEETVQAGIDKIIISIDSFNKKIYSQTRVGGNLELVLENLEYLRNRRRFKNFKFEIVVQARRQKLNEAEIFPKWVLIRPATKRTEGSDYLLDNQKSIGRKNCLMPFRRLLISWEGRAFGCCADWYELNSVGQVGYSNGQTLSEIWNGKLIDKLRKDLTNGKAFEYEPCKSCFSKEAYIWKKSE
jgi:MoaA/NifB/PqqE/SkfB family radical SAM enzyme